MADGKICWKLGLIKCSLSESSLEFCIITSMPLLIWIFLNLCIILKLEAQWCSGADGRAFCGVPPFLTHSDLSLEPHLKRQCYPSWIQSKLFQFADKSYSISIRFHWKPCPVRLLEILDVQTYAYHRSVTSNCSVLNPRPAHKSFSASEMPWPGDWEVTSSADAFTCKALWNRKKLPDKNFECVGSPRMKKKSCGRECSQKGHFGTCQT
ncbi:hypothetical protein OIU74_028766 [Salix koriyanagi]|uniref:Uncharacterized protein n=1 Tax=Salix koriyanagi TaxID=2511006 RepID=A0A9Q0VCZ6_9ROSI|nr:hypothetical protein OIU74_028766 [Salix koriyanagi]